MSTSTTERIGTGLAALPRVNLLPPEIMVRRRLRRVQGTCGGAALAAAAAVVAATILAASAVGPAQSNLNTANAKQAQLQQQSAQFGDVTATYDRASQIQQILTTATAGEIHWSAFLNRLATTTPTNVQLKTMTVAPGAAATTPAGTTTTGVIGSVTPAPALPTITFDGYAQSHDAVAHWLDVLATQRAVTNPYFTKSDQNEVGGKSVYEFEVTVSVAIDALQSKVDQGGN